MPVVFDSSGPVREMFESFAPQVMQTSHNNRYAIISVEKICQEDRLAWIVPRLYYEREERKCQMKNWRTF